MSRWYRAYAGTATDPKLGGIALRANVSRSVTIAAWHVILESAAEANAGGATDIDEFAIAASLGEPLEDIQRVVAAFAAADMFKDGCVTAWGRRQYESDTSAERTKRWRERNGNVTEDKSDADVTSQKKSVTVSSVSVSDSVLKKEEEIEKGFEEFWKLRPSRKGDNPRRKALKAYKAAINHGFSIFHINGAAKLWAQNVEPRRDTEFIPMASTWLNEHRFIDLIPKVADEASVLEQEEFMRRRGFHWVDGKWSRIEAAE